MFRNCHDEVVNNTKCNRTVGIRTDRRLCLLVNLTYICTVTMLCVFVYCINLLKEETINNMVDHGTSVT